VARASRIARRRCRRSNGWRRFMRRQFRLAVPAADGSNILASVMRTRRLLHRAPRRSRPGPRTTRHP
jgi:hypothetical protein